MIILIYIRRLWFYLIPFLLIIGCQKDQELFIPEVKLDVFPLEGNTTTIFKISSVYENIPSQIKLFNRWDFQGDSIWDTDYTNSNIKNFRYLKPGTYHPRIQVLTSA